MALVEAHAQENVRAIAEAKAALAPVSTTDVLYGLLRFGQMIGPYIEPEHREVVTTEFAAVEGSREMKAAVATVGRILLLEPRQDAVKSAANTYLVPLSSSPDDAVRRAVLQIADAFGCICQKLDVAFKWKE